MNNKNKNGKQPISYFFLLLKKRKMKKTSLQELITLPFPFLIIKTKKIEMSCFQSFLSKWELGCQVR